MQQYFTYGRRRRKVQDVSDAHLPVTVLRMDAERQKRTVLVPFAISGGSGMGKTVDELKKLCPNADWKAGRMLNGI